MQHEIQELDYSNLRDLKKVATLFSQELEPRGDTHWWRMEALDWENKTRSHNLKVFIARKSGKIVGAALGLIDEPSNNPAEINGKLGTGPHYCLGGAAVLPQFRRMGISTALHRKMLEHATSLNCKTVYGATASTNVAQKRQLEKDGYALFHRQVRSDIGEVHWYRKML